VKKRQNHESREQAVIPTRPEKYEAFAKKNDERLLQVYVGMNRKTVEKLMGRRGYYKREFIRNEGNQGYEVLFYLTRVPQKGKAVTERHLTPVLFKKDRVQAVGHYQLRKLRQSAGPAYASVAAIP
jgi:uncharacterized protein DUF3192